MEYKTLEIRKIGKDTVNSVLASELHERLEVKTKLSDWLDRKVIKGMFDEKVDYLLVYGTFNETQFKVSDFKGTPNEAKARHLSKNVILTLDTSKELSMMENNIKGKESRTYFINVEKVAKNILGEEKLKAELKQLELSNDKLERENIEMIASQEDRAITGKVINKMKQLKALKDFGFDIDPTSLIDRKQLKSILPKDITEILSTASGDIRTNAIASSATFLLNKFNLSFKAKDLIDVLIKYDYAERVEFNGKFFNRWVDTINFYGFNKSYSSRRINPSSLMFYQDRFLKLIDLLQREEKL